MVHSEKPGVPPASEINQEIYSRRVDFGSRVSACGGEVVVLFHTLHFPQGSLMRLIRTPLGPS